MPTPYQQLKFSRPVCTTSTPLQATDHCFVYLAGQHVQLGQSCICGAMQIATLSVSKNAEGGINQEFTYSPVTP